MKTNQSIYSSTIEGTKTKRICSSTIEGTKRKRSICSPTIEGMKTKRSIRSSTIEGTKTERSIHSSTIEGMKTKQSIRSSTIDDLPLLVIYDLRPPHIWLKICVFPHILGSPSSKMTLQPLHSEFPYIWGKFYFLFHQCTYLSSLGGCSASVLGLLRAGPGL